MITLGLQESERWEKFYVETEPAKATMVETSNPTPHPADDSMDVATDAGMDGSPPKEKSFLMELHSSSTSGPCEEDSENEFRPVGRNDDVMFDIRDDRQVNLTTDGVEDWQEHSVATTSKTLDYYDAFEGDSVAGSLLAAPETSDTATNVAQIQDRKGARCPVHGVFLVASGDQLFAPYLLRPEPLTDDLILERRQMLSRSIVNEKGIVALNHNTTTVQHRLEVAQRLQKPKLLSDMSAFKAANPGAVFLDFVQWYGNPGNPLEDYGPSDEAVVQAGSAVGKNVAEKLDKASEAIHILTATRDFWSNTWDEATSCPASEQKPLFDVCSTVEIALDYLETMHPANLLNQVMAVNLATANFVLSSSAGDARKISVVRKVLNCLRETTTRALQLLACDVTQGTWSLYTRGKAAETNTSDHSPIFVSAEALTACEIACNALADAETVISRCTSLLQKFPGQFDLVEKLMIIGQAEVNNATARASILRTISRQQRPMDPALSEEFSKPAMREYVFRNVDDANPCQLSVRLGDESVMFEGGDPGGSLLLALTKTHRE
jgi:Rab3 GTPase-activating protein catalytic subunit